MTLLGGFIERRRERKLLERLRFRLTGHWSERVVAERMAEVREQDAAHARLKADLRAGLIDGDEYMRLAWEQLERWS